MSKKTKGELLFESLLTSKGIYFEKIKESNNKGEKTPDYLIIIDNINFYCEIKDFDYLEITEERGYKKNFGLNGEELFSSKEDKSYNKVARTIINAYKQLEKFNKKVLVLCNYDISIDSLDLENALQGYLKTTDPDIIIGKVQSDIFKNIIKIRNNIDLYIFFNNIKNEIKFITITKDGELLKLKLEK